MSKAVEIIKSLLKNPSIKKILVAENHFDYTPKEVLIELLDDIEHGEFQCPRIIVFVFEHLSVKEQIKIDNAVKNKTFSDDMEIIFNRFPFVEPQDLSLNMFVELGKRAITAGVQIIATENEATGYSSLFASTQIKRIRSANKAFEEAFEAEIFEQENVVAIFLGGAAHVVDMHPNYEMKPQWDSIMGLKTALSEHSDTVALYIFDEGGNFSYKNDDESTSSLISIEGFHGNNFDECISVKPAKKLLKDKEAVHSSRVSREFSPGLICSK